LTIIDFFILAVYHPAQTGIFRDGAFACRDFHVAPIRPTRQAIQLAIHLIDTPVMKLSAVPLRTVQYDTFSVKKLLYYKLKA
jgi:hypothetical protein